jgi:cadmium resistance protein CadD (predicted permease)
MYNLKIIKSGKRIEIYKINNYVIVQGKTHEGTKIIEGILEGENQKEKQEKEKQSNKDRKTTLNNARNNIIRLIKANDDMNTFITLTFAEEQDYKESKKSLNIFFTKLRKNYNALKYIWILEYGDKNNRLHYHLLCNIPIGIKMSSSKEKKSQEHKVLENNFSKRYWKYGFVDIRKLDQEGNTNIALYVATYITKSMDNKELEGYRIYGYSRKTLNKPIETKIYTRDSIEKVLKDFSEYEIEFSNSYSIGYKDWRGDHIGKVNYYDLKLKESRDYENKKY